MTVGGKRSAAAGRRAMGAVSGAPFAVRQNTKIMGDFCDYWSQTSKLLLSSEWTATQVT